MKKTEIAYFAAGCFWGIEAAYRELDGVTETRVGYMGGTTKSPTYEDVCSNTTGHAETVKVVYDPAVISYDDLLKTFWSIHDPTQVNKQGPDVGSQYRSVIFYTTDEQKQAAKESKKKLQESGKYGAKTIATSIEQAPEFYEAEEYHQRYFEKGGKAVCHPNLKG